MHCKHYFRVGNVICNTFVYMVLGMTENCTLLGFGVTVVGLLMEEQSLESSTKTKP